MQFQESFILLVLFHVVDNKIGHCTSIPKFGSYHGHRFSTVNTNTYPTTEQNPLLAKLITTNPKVHKS